MDDQNRRLPEAEHDRIATEVANMVAVNAPLEVVDGVVVIPNTNRVAASPVADEREEQETSAPEHVQHES